MKNRTSLTVFRAIVRNETRQLWRKRSFWIISGVLAIPPFFLLFGALGYPIGESLVGSGAPGLSSLSLFFLVMPLLIGPAILRDLDQVGEILWSCPLDAFTHFAGSFVGLWLALLPASLLQLGGWFLVDLFWPNTIASWVWLLSLAIVLLVNVIGISLVTLLAAAGHALNTRRILTLYLGWAVLWVALFFSLIFSEGLGETFFPMQATAFYNIFFHNLKLSASLGLGLATDRVVGMSVWFLGVSLAASGLALFLLLLADRRRAVRRAWLPLLFLAGSLCLAAAGYALNTQAIIAHAQPISPIDPQIDAWQVLSQQTEVVVKPEVNPDSGSISGTSRLVLSPQVPLTRPEIILRLNPGLSLTAANAETGQSLPVQRIGDSLAIGLPAIPTEPLTLDLAWQGRLRYPFSIFEMEWKHADAPFPINFMYMPQVIQGLLTSQGGYLLRDGDWMPWPWTSLPHHAEQSSLVIHPAGGDPAAPGEGSSPLQAGQVAYQEPLPEALLAFLPDRQVSLDGTTLSFSPLVGDQQIQQGRLFAEAAAQLSALTGEPALRQIVIAPYLSRLVWSNDLLLVPDGSGYYLSDPFTWMYRRDTTGRDRPLVARATLAALTRTWLLNRQPPAPLEFQPRLLPDGKEPQTAEDGSWIHKVENLDVQTAWNPRRQTALTPAGEWAAVAFWLALELSDPQIRQADLDLIAYFAGEGKELKSGNKRSDLMSRLLWPSTLDTESGRQIVWDLHQWAEAVGSQEALALAMSVIQENQPGSAAEYCRAAEYCHAEEYFRVDQFISELEERSGLTIGKEQP
jgi:hypothetical protein